MNVGDLIKEGEYYVNLDYGEWIDIFNDCWNIVNCIVFSVFVIIQYLLIRRAWKEW